MSQAAECMAYVNSTAAREKFRLLMAAQQEPLVVEQTFASQEEIKQIVSLRKKGLNYNQIAEMVGRSRSMVTSVCKKHK